MHGVQIWMNQYLMNDWQSNSNTSIVTGKLKGQNSYVILSKGGPGVIIRIKQVDI